MNSDTLRGSKLAMLVALTIGLGLVVVACSGGGGGGSSPTAPAPPPSYSQQGGLQTNGEDPAVLDEEPLVCDPPPIEDPDGDCVENSDGTDLCPEDYDPLNTDSDGDSIGDVCDDDADGDGYDDLTADLCPGTVFGAAVDANGCSAAQVDEDGDGICDPGLTFVSTFCTGTDLCPATPPLTPVDENGCTDAQVDVDNDGVCEVSTGPSAACTGTDLCVPSQSTATGAALAPEGLSVLVDADGCSVADTCDCEAATNHGNYVSCVTQTAQDFRKTGLITNQEKSDYVTEAAQSSCGK